MKVIIISDNAHVGDKNLPMDYSAKKGQIVEMNPNTANNWLIPAGIVIQATEENIRLYQEQLFKEGKC